MPSLSIARALLRNAPILLLDEATSALDADTEEKVLQNIVQRHPNRLIIVSTHRLGVLKLCQKIYRITDGGMKQLDAAEAETMVRQQLEQGWSKNGPMGNSATGSEMAKARERQAVARMMREAQEQAANEMEGSKDHYMQGEKGWWDL